MIAKLKKAACRPTEAMYFLSGRMNGLRYKFWYALTNPRVKIGRKFSVHGRLKIKGPGRVVMGDHVLVDGSGQTVTPFTHHGDALIEIGSYCFINGTRFGCEKEIRISERAILADCRIMDTDFHSIREDRWSPDAPIESKPIIIERNVWIAASAAVLKGVTIGENSVVGFGAVVTSSIPPNSLVAGNPAKVLGEIPKKKAS